MALSITVHGQGTFTASMEEGPVTFTAAIASVGPQGATGPTGPSGVVAATAPITYDSGTQTVGISATPTFTSVTATTGNLTTVNLTTATFADATSQTTAFVGEARKVYVTARNSTGSTIAKGKVVYLSGGTGNVPNVALALADSESTSARTIGITAEAISNNSNGKVIISGAVENIDTSAFSDGDTVYLSASTAGGLTTTLPTQPLHGVVIGIVTRANPSVGSIEVAINNYQELKELSDVAVSDRANNDGLFWESSSSTWRSKTIAEVLGYTPANNASVLLAANNLSDLASASTARTNLGLGTMAVETASDYLTKAGNLSGLASASTARTNLGLGTMATETAANYALLASPTFTGDPKAPTPATSDNDTSIATTAFVNAYCPAASDTTAGKVELATSAEVDAKSSTTLAVTPSALADFLVAPQVCIADISGSTAVTNVGTTNVGSAGVRLVLSASGSASGQYAARYFGGSSNSTVPHFLYRGEAFPSLDKRTLLSARVRLVTIANSTHRLTFGKLSTGAVGNLSDKGFGIRVVGTGAVELQVHNGTTLTNVTSSFTPTSQFAFDVVVENVGNGTVNLYVNDSLVATSSAGGTGDYSTSTIPTIWMETELTGAIASNINFMTNNVFLATVS